MSADPDYYCFRTHRAHALRGNVGNCSNAQSNPNDPKNSTIFRDPEDCCTHVGVGGGYTKMRNGRRCFACAPLLGDCDFFYLYCTCLR